MLVYIREAHATDEWVKDYNEEVGIRIRQPRTATARRGVANRSLIDLGIRMQGVVDDMDDFRKAATAAVHLFSELADVGPGA